MLRSSSYRNFHLPSRSRDRRSASSPWWHSRWRWLRHKLGAAGALALLLLGTTSFLGCGQIASLDSPEWAAVCSAVLWCDAPAEPAELVDVLLHSFVGSPATPEAARTVIRQVLHRVIDRPGSLVRLWVAGTETTLISELESPALEHRSRRSQKAERERWLIAAEAELLIALSPRLAAAPHEPSSLAESIATVALAASGTPQSSYQLVVIADGREKLLKSANTELMMADAATLDQLPWRTILIPGLLRSNAHVHLTFFDPPPLPGLPATYSIRFALYEALWGDVLWQAGAKEVFIEGGDKGVHFTDSPFPFRDSTTCWLLPSVPRDESSQK